MNVRRALGFALGAAVALVLAACGGSVAPGVHAAPAGAMPATPGAGALASGSPDQVETPTPPSPLASEPAIAVPRAPAPERLVVRDLITGRGDVAKPGDQVTVNYVGVLYRDGKRFDSSWQRRQTFSTNLINGSMISGWVKGIVGERVGGRRELIIPPNLAYGSDGNPPKVPSDATLIFDVDLLSVSDGGGDD